MARAPNLLDSAPLTISINVIIRAYLEDLVRTGFYGKSRAEAAERLIEAGINQAIKQGRIPRRESHGNARAE